MAPADERGRLGRDGPPPALDRRRRTDLVALLDDCDELEASIAATQDAERTTIAAFLQWLSHHPYRDELVDGNVVGRGDTRPARSRRLWLRIGSLVEMLR